MKYLFYMVLLPVTLIVIFLFYTGVFNTENELSDNTEQTEQKKGGVPKQWETKTDDKSPVTLSATPIEFGKNANIWKFAITLNTHAGSLDDDLVTAVTLSDDDGNIFLPISWEGAAPGGHHREGVLIFNKVIPVPFSVELKFKNIGGVPERSFKWNIE